MGPTLITGRPLLIYSAPPRPRSMYPQPKNYARTGQSVNAAPDDVQRDFERTHDLMFAAVTLLLAVFVIVLVALIRASGGGAYPGHSAEQVPESQDAGAGHGLGASLQIGVLGETSPPQQN